MYVIFPAIDVVDESYLSLVAQENENPPPTGLRPSPHPTPSPVPPVAHPGPTFHDTRPEQEAAEQEIARQNAAADSLVPVIPRLTQFQPPADSRDQPDCLYSPPSAEPDLPDLVPALTQGQFHSPAGLTRTRPDVKPAASSRVYSGKVLTEIPMASSNEEAPALETSTGIRKGRAVLLKHLKHPELNESLKSQQQVTFRLVKSGKRSVLSFYSKI